MSKRILLIQGHPDGGARHFCHALADAYSTGAVQAGHEVRTTAIAAIEFPLLRSQEDWEKGSVPETLRSAQEDIRWAEHIVLIFPLWLGDMPALVKGFLEQVARPGFAFAAEEGGPAFHKKGLTGRSARVIVTMGMPALVYRWYFRAHTVKSLERNILGFVGISPINETLIGMVANLDSDHARAWEIKLQRLGAKAR